MLYVIDQDRETVVKFNPSKPLFTAPNIQQGQLFGFNLMYGSVLLGTFDSQEESIQEICNILNCKGIVYFVSGFCEGITPTDEMIMRGWMNFEME